jgi:biopolymer transport protein ExbD
MAMQVGGESGDDALNSTINTTPLVDVMLVMLIIFLITVPVVIQTIPVRLPQANNIPTVTKPENVVVSVDQTGTLFINLQKIPDDKTFLERMVEVAKIGSESTDPTARVEVHIRADKDAPFKYVGKTVWMIQRAGVGKVGFISEPQAGVVERFS